MRDFSLYMLAQGELEIIGKTRKQIPFLNWVIMILFCFRIPDRLTMDSSEIFRGGGEQCHHCQAVEQQLLLATEENGTVEPMPPTIDCPLGDCHVTAGLSDCNSSSWLRRNN